MMYNLECGAVSQVMAERWNTDHVQTEELFAKLLKGGN